MPDWTSFTDDEISQIKTKLNKKFDKALVVTLLFSPIFCLVVPYLPGKRGRKRMIDRMEYDEAVLQFAIIWLLVLIGVWIWNNYKVNKQFRENRKFLRKKIIIASVRTKKKSIFKSYENIIETNLEGELEAIEVGKQQSSKFNIGDNLKIEIEEQTNTVLKIENER